MKARNIVGIVLMMAVSLAILASDAPSSHNGKSRMLTLSTPVRVGSAMLPAGDYKVQQVNDGDSHMLVFKVDRKEVARINCTMEMLPEKAKSTLLSFDRNRAGERVLVGIVFPGESIRHDLQP